MPVQCFGALEPTKQENKTGFSQGVTTNNTTGTTNSVTGAPDWMLGAGQQNYNQARSILDAGFQPYTGEMVAPLSSNEQAASGMVRNAAATPDPYTGYASNAFTSYGQAPAYNFDWSNVVDPNSPLGPMSNYMNPYLDAVLAPQLRQLGISGAQARQTIGAGATNAGAYGDARQGIAEAEQLKNQALAETDTTGKAYSDAFGTALQQRQQDLSRRLSTEQAQQGANEQQLARLQQSGIDLTNLDKYDTSRTLGLASALGTTGATERGVQQQQDTANMQEFMRKQGWTDQQIQFLTQVMAGTPSQKITSGTTGQAGSSVNTAFNQGTTTTEQPNNTGWQALGSLASAVFA